MSVRFGVFVPQGWRMDLLEIADPVEKYEAMTAVAREADAGCRQHKRRVYQAGRHDA